MESGETSQLFSTIKSAVEVFYGTNSNAKRQEAHRFLVEYGTGLNVEHFPQLRQCLGLCLNEKDDKVQYYVLSGVHELLKRQLEAFDGPTILEFRGELEQMLTHVMDSPEYVIKKLCRAIGFIVKGKWLKDQRHRDIQQVPMKLFAMKQPKAFCVAFIYLETIVNEMQIQLTNITSASRRISRSFRDEALEKVLKLALEFVKNVLNDGEQSKTHEQPLQKALVLILEILRYDFTAIGIGYRVSEDIHQPLMTPATWTFLKKKQTFEIFFNITSKRLAKITQQLQQNTSFDGDVDSIIKTNDLASLAFSVVVLLANPRKTQFARGRSVFLANSQPRSMVANDAPTFLFSEMEHFVSSFIFFFDEIWRQNRDILQRSRTLKLKCCKLLRRLTTICSWKDFSQFKQFEQWVTLLFDFIVTSLGNKDNFDGNVYLLQICSGLSQSIFQQELQQHRQQIIKKLEQVLDVYLQSVFHLCELYANEELADNPVKNGEIQAQVYQLTEIFRLNYGKLSGNIVNIIERFLEEMQKYADQKNAKAYYATELKTVICLSLIKEIVEENYNSTSTGDASQYDANLFCSVLKVAFWLEQFRRNCIAQNNLFVLLEQNGIHVQLSLALLECLQSIHSICGMHELRRFEHLDEFQLFGKNGDMRTNTPPQPTNILTHLMERIGKKAEKGQEYSYLIRFLLDHLMYNLQSWGTSEPILYRTLQCLEKIVMNTSMCKQGSDCFNFLKEIAAKCSTEMPFLREPKMIKMRTSYFAVLASSLFLLHEGSLTEVFFQLLTPIEANIKEILSGHGNAQHRTLKCVYIFRDLRGISMAARTQPAYQMLGDWLLHQSPFLDVVCRECSDKMAVMHPALKFFREITLNRKQRLKYSRHSAFPYKLFRICTKFIQHVVSHDRSKNEGFDTEDEYTQSITLEEVYSTKYKSIKECCWILGHFFQAKHVNFACLRLYNEPLVEVIPFIVNQLVSIPFEHIMTFTDLQHAVQFFFCGLFVSCPFILSEVSTEALSQIFNMMFAFLHSCNKQRSCVVGGMIIQEHSVITRPLMFAIEAVGKYWEDIKFQPNEILKKAWIELLRCGNSQITRWTLCAPPMYSFVSLLNEDHRTDLLKETSQVLQETSATEERIALIVKEMKAMFDKVPYAEKKGFLRRNRTQPMFCQNLVQLLCASKIAAK